MLVRRSALFFALMGAGACSFPDYQFRPAGSGGLGGIGGSGADGSGGSSGSDGGSGSGGDETGGSGGVGASGGSGGASGAGASGGSTTTGGSGGAGPGGAAGSGASGGTGGSGAGTGGSSGRALGATCGRDDQCESLTCRGLHCRPPSCEDGAPGSEETDIDCGGPSCARCPSGASCLDDSDCSNDNCMSGTCERKLSVYCSCSNCDSSTTTIDLTFYIENAGDDLDLVGLSVRYYYSGDGSAMDQTACVPPEAGINGGCAAINVASSRVDLDDERALVATLPSHYLGTGSKTGNINLTLTTESGTHEYSQDDDYSHAQRNGTLSECERVTLHRVDGEVLWGVEPGSYLE